MTMKIRHESGGAQADNLKFAPSAEQIKRAHVTNQDYLALYQKSDDPEEFWREQGQTIEWMKPFNCQ